METVSLVLDTKHGPQQIQLDKLSFPKEHREMVRVVKKYTKKDYLVETTGGAKLLAALVKDLPKKKRVKQGDLLMVHSIEEGRAEIAEKLSKSHIKHFKKNEEAKQQPPDEMLVFTFSFLFMED